MARCHKDEWEGECPIQTLNPECHTAEDGSLRKIPSIRELGQHPLGDREEAHLLPTAALAVIACEAAGFSLTGAA